MRNTCDARAACTSADLFRAISTATPKYEFKTALMPLVLYNIVGSSALDQAVPERNDMLNHSGPGIPGSSSCKEYQSPLR